MSSFKVLNQSEHINLNNLDCKKLLLKLLSNDEEYPSGSGLQGNRSKERPCTSRPNSYNQFIISDEDEDMFSGDNDLEKSYESSARSSSFGELFDFNEIILNNDPGQRIPFSHSKDVVKQTNKQADKLNNEKFASESCQYPALDERVLQKSNSIQSEPVRSNQKTDLSLMDTVYSAILKLNERLSELSYNTAKLEEEISSCNHNLTHSNGFKRSREEYEAAFPIGSLIDCEFTLNDQKVSVPVREKDDVKTLNFILKNNDVFGNVLKYLTRIYGTAKQRNMTKVVSKLVDALISPECLSKFTWTGKTSIGKKEKFKDMTNIHKVIYETANIIDKTLEFEDFKHIIVDSVMKYAHERDPEKKKRKRMAKTTVVKQVDIVESKE